ncbi:Alpha-amylase [Penicillium cf. griseofulvum]|uniref:alpha-amylase n=1 Tax=Penicillium cf. griseofulvum TaxID=2972120 RepID=A0A9W9J5P8_9EURO|nr:Alpha-amylase [Penicillium cf. griseofulvum]KAJ5427832.1 Alpha-amylase [Penicillium cf. griseofulvum]
MLLARFAWLAGLASTAIAATPAEWRSQSIYFMLTDRFARTDGSTTAACNTSDRKYCGGTWRGIIEKLDYIQGMGFTAIWITPVTGQLTEDTKYGEAYHGYWQQDINSLNPNYGTADDLKALAAALHKRDMYLMVDVVANHMGYDGAGADVDFSKFNSFNDAKYFHPYCPITDYNNDTMAQNCWLGDSTVSLPDLNTQSKEVQNIWYDWVGKLVTDYSIDGLRVDTVKHVQKDFWPGYNKAAGVYCVGEVLNGNVDYTCPYQEVMDGVLNYPIYYPLLNAFQSTKPGSMAALYDMINTVKSTCKDSTLLGNFLENHDNPRFASVTDDIALAKNAATFTIMTDGIPIVYAGQEQHYSSGEDPANREALWLSGFNTDSELYKLIAKANGARNQAIAKGANYTTYQNYPIYKDDNTIAMRKGDDGEQVITVLTNLGVGGKEYSLSIPETGFKAGDKLTEIVSCASVTVAEGGKVPVPMAGGEPRILLPTSLLKGSSLCSS